MQQPKLQLGKKRWDNECPLRLASEAIISRLGDIASKPTTEVGVSTRHG
jgi:hypothetical protein